MKRSMMPIYVIVLMFVLSSCNFPGIVDDEPDKGGGDAIDQGFQTSQGWDCSPSDLKSYLGEKWQPYRNLDLKMYLRGGSYTFDLNFGSESTFIVKRDPDYRPPPGATLIPEGEYQVEEIYKGFGDLTLDGEVYTGSTKLEYTLTTLFPEPEITEGKIAFRAVGHLVADNILEICLDVYEGGYDDAFNAPHNHLAPNCRWPGYIFSCTPENN